MTSRVHKKTPLGLTFNPETPHEEIMHCIESTNDIVSEILEEIQKHHTLLWYEGYQEGNKE